MLLRRVGAGLALRRWSRARPAAGRGGGPSRWRRRSRSRGCPTAPATRPPPPADLDAGPGPAGRRCPRLAPDAGRSPRGPGWSGGRRGRPRPWRRAVRGRRAGATLALPGRLPAVRAGLGGGGGGLPRHGRWTRRVGAGPAAAGRGPASPPARACALAGDRRRRAARVGLKVAAARPAAGADAGDRHRLLRAGGAARAHGRRRWQRWHVRPASTVAATAVVVVVALVAATGGAGPPARAVGGRPVAPSAHSAPTGPPSAAS